MTDVLAHVGRELLGSSQVSHSDSATTKNYRGTESTLFQIGMIILGVGYTLCFCEPSPSPASLSRPLKQESHESALRCTNPTVHCSGLRP